MAEYRLHFPVLKLHIITKHGGQASLHRADVIISNYIYTEPDIKPVKRHLKYNTNNIYTMLIIVVITNKK